MDKTNNYHWHNETDDVREIGRQSVYATRLSHSFQKCWIEFDLHNY